MRRTTTALVAVMLVVGSLAAFPIAGLAAQTTDTGTESNSAQSNTTESNATVSPGEQLAGVVGVQEAEIEGEVDSRAFGIRVAQAADNDSRAAVVGEQLGDIEERLDELEQRRQELDSARENGSMSEGQYRARMAQLSAETRTVERLANQSNETAQGLPAETLEANGVNVTAIQTLKDRAQNLGGPEVAEIARSIAGANTGNGFGPAQAGERGPDRGNETGSQDATSSDDRDAGSGQPTDDGTTSTETVTETQRDGSEASDGQGR